MIEIPLEDADPSKLGRIIITALAVDSAWVHFFNILQEKCKIPEFSLGDYSS
jgi:hypothetical protein